MLGGGLSAWARGGPKSEHDVDFLLRRTTQRRRSRRSRRAGWKTERPPEGWLYKAWHENGALVDLIFSPASGPITDEIIDSAPVAEVMALRIHVVVARGHHDVEADGDDRAGAGLRRVLEWARALREQIDWDDVRARTEASPFAKAFFTLVEALGVVERGDT